ncbi:MAG: hypothetical protein IJ080_08140, partial [Oscillospiraceae bacterium]|nr:hypothetical protein [Oscillospiraceae bacterium]
YITIEGLPEGIEYTVSEDFEDYTAELASTGVDKTTGGSVASPDADTTDMSLSTAGSVGTTEDTYMQDDAVLTFTNRKHGVIPTCIVLSAAAPVVIGVSAIGGIVYLSLRRRREDEE